MLRPTVSTSAIFAFTFLSIFVQQAQAAAGNFVRFPNRDSGGGAVSYLAYQPQSAEI